MECIANQKCNGASQTNRLSYLERITYEFSKARNFELPSAGEARSFDEALAHVVRLFPSKRERDSTAPFTELKACRRRKASRKDCLREILDALQSMERKRMYDPPADDEIGFYLLIKKYVRAIFTFFSVRTGLDDMFYNKFGCISYFNTLHQAEELVELNRYFADFSAFVSELNIEDGSVIKPLMGIQDNYEVPPLIHGSKERNNIFYYHKFSLARSDIKTCESALFPPSAEEERSYLRVLDHIAPNPSVKTKDEVSVYSEELYQLYLEKLERETSDMARHCTLLRKSLLEKISMHESWKHMVEMHYQADDADELRRKLVEQCRVPHSEDEGGNEELKKYIMSVERCRDIAHGVSLIVDARLTVGCDELTEPTYSCPETMRRFGWEALHALTLLKHGSFSPGNIFREHIVLRNSKNENARMELECKEAKRGLKRCAQGNENGNVKMNPKCRRAKTELKRCCQGSENENVRVPRGVVEDLRLIQDSKNGNVRMKLECKEAKMGLKRCGQGDEDENIKMKLERTRHKSCGQGSENEHVKKKLKCKEEVQMGLKRCAQGMENGNVKNKLECKKAKIGQKHCGQVRENENVKKKLKCKAAQVVLKRCAQISENENVRVLRGIVEDLKCIRDSDVLLDEEEYKEEHVLMLNIWCSVASSAHFFFSAMAYEQRRYVIQCGRSIDVRKFGVRRTKRMKKNCTDAIETRNKAYQVRDQLYQVQLDMNQSKEILNAYVRGLRDEICWTENDRGAVADMMRDTMMMRRSSP